ncbi:LptF/LptG family permease [Deinococcus aquiradiocola]|uniref:LptF/LptG family permease n=1 Tax=Deinococcus aquiradiocola TaxID=393059 RepID=UPI00166844F0|nr:LptF/LptG family permease [Deinococcus aquiradiocola]
MKRFDRYVLEEILPYLLSGLAVVILLLLLAALQSVIAPLLAKGAAPLLVLRLVALQVPEAVSRGLPIALLFAAMLGLSRLSSDAELKAAQSGGLSGTRLFWPVLALALGVSLLSFTVAETLVPRAKVEALQVQRDIVLDNPRVLGLGDGRGGTGVVLRDALGRAISVAQVRPGGRLEGLRIVTLRDGQGAREVITARRGTLTRNVLMLESGVRVTYQDTRPVTVVRFRSGTLPVQDLQASLSANDELLPIYLPLPKLIANVRSMAAQGIRSPRDFTALQRKFAEPLAAVTMAFFAVALSIYSLRSGVNIGLVWVLMLTFAYYATWSVFRVLGETGALSPVLAAWTPTLIYLLAGLGLLGVAARR